MTGRGAGGGVVHDAGVPVPRHLIQAQDVQVPASAVGVAIRPTPRNVNTAATSIRIFRNAITSFQILNSSLEEGSQQASCILRPEFE